MGDPIIILQQIIDAHPKSVHQLLLTKGIKERATPELLIKRFKKEGKHFGYELTAAIQRDNVKVSNFDPNWDDITSVLTAGAGLTAAIGNVTTGKNPYVTTPQGLIINTPQQQQKSQKTANTLMWVGIAVIVLILTVIIILKFRKK